MGKGSFFTKAAIAAAGAAAAYAVLRKKGEIEPITSKEFGDSVKAYGKKSAMAGIEKAVPGALSGFERFLHEPAAFSSGFQNTNFYAGTEEFLQQPAKKARWQLGFAWASLVPEDWREHPYYLGGYMVPDNGFNNRVENIIDDMRIRCIALSDDSGRGAAVFGTIDCIGISNKDIRVIRGKVAEKAESAGIALCGITVCSTHCHSGIDTQGLWTKGENGKMASNIKKSVCGEDDLEKGVDMHYMEFLYERAADALFRALCDMTPGKMTFAQKDIGAGYFSNKNRPSATALPTEMNRFLFTPADKKKAPTMILNLGAHPDVAGLPTSDGAGTGREVCGEYVYYMGEKLASYGYNCMFFNGAIAGIYMARGLSNDGVALPKRYMQSARYGRELAKLAMALTMTEDEIRKNEALFEPAVVNAEKAESAQNGGEYTLWCENWTPVAERELPAVLNVRFRMFDVRVTNPLIRVAGKLDMANYDIMPDDEGNYTVTTEIGYMEWGGVKVVMVPGELVTDLYKGGGSLTAEGSCQGCTFRYPCLCDIFGRDTLCFGLANDAIGYIVPDNDYSMRLFDGHYHETISLGDVTASSMMRAFIALAADVL